MAGIEPGIFYMLRRCSTTELWLTSIVRQLPPQFRDSCQPLVFFTDWIIWEGNCWPIWELGAWNTSILVQQLKMTVSHKNASFCAKDSQANVQVPNLLGGGGRASFFIYARSTFIRCSWRLYGCHLTLGITQSLYWSKTCDRAHVEFVRLFWHGKRFKLEMEI